MKKKFLVAISCLLLCTSLAGCGSKANTTTLIMSDTQEDEHPTARASQKFADLVKERTHGRVEIELYTGSKLGSEAEQVAQVTVGGIDFVRASSSVISKYYDPLKAFQALYIFPSEEAMWTVLDGSVGDEFLQAKELADSNIEGLCWFSGGSRNFYNNKKTITSPADLAGLKLRVNTDSMFALLGNANCEGINVAYTDIFNSINAGVIDGAENNWPSYISTEHYKVAKNITIDEHTRIPEMIVASKSAMDKLSPQDAEIVRQCAREASQIQRKYMQEFDAEAIATAEAEGCTITYLTPEQIKKFQDAAVPVNEQVSADYMDIIKKLQAAQ